MSSMSLYPLPSLLLYLTLLSPLFLCPMFLCPVYFIYLFLTVAFISFIFQTCYFLFRLPSIYYFPIICSLHPNFSPLSCVTRLCQKDPNHFLFFIYFFPTGIRLQILLLSIFTPTFFNFFFFFFFQYSMYALNFLLV